MISQRTVPCRAVLAALIGALCLACAGPGRSDALPPQVRRSVLHWWHAEGQSAMPKTSVELASQAGRRFMQVTIDDPAYRGATGNETYFLYLLERGRWQRLFTAIGLGYFARPGGPGRRPWVETYAHDSAAVAVYQLWEWDRRKRAYALGKEWAGPYPETMQFVVPPGGLPPAKAGAATPGKKVSRNVPRGGKR